MSYSISVALCTFNGARFIEEQVGSILNQSLPPGEIVVSDNVSTDDTRARIRSVYDAHGDTSIALRILTGDAGLGVTRNFQRAIEACTGELIALSDHDDVWHSVRLAAAVPAFDADPSLLLQQALPFPGNGFMTNGWRSLRRQSEGCSSWSRCSASTVPGQTRCCRARETSTWCVIC